MKSLVPSTAAPGRQQQHRHDSSTGMVGQRTARRTRRRTGARGVASAERGAVLHKVHHQCAPSLVARLAAPTPVRARQHAPPVRARRCVSAVEGCRGRRRVGARRACCCQPGRTALRGGDAATRTLSVELIKNPCESWQVRRPRRCVFAAAHPHTLNHTARAPRDRTHAPRRARSRRCA